MRVSRADMDLCAAVLSRRFARFLPADRKAPMRGLYDPARLVHAAINARAGLKMHGGWGNTVALLVLVRSNIRTGAHKEHATLIEYIHAHTYAYEGTRDAARSKYYRKILLGHAKAIIRSPGVKSQ